MVVLIGVVLKLPEYITKTWLEQTKNRNAHSIQIESYFKKVSVSKQEEVLNKWTDFLTDMKATTQKYTSYHIDPLTLLKLEISDYEKYEEIYTACAKKIQKQIKE